MLHLYYKRGLDNENYTSGLSICYRGGRQSRSIASQHLSVSVCDSNLIGFLASIITKGEGYETKEINFQIVSGLHRPRCRKGC